MLLDRARSQLLIVDVQERLLPAMHEGERMVERCAVLLQAAQRLRVPVTLSEQYRKGLGATVERLHNLKGDAPVLEKMHFSCAADGAITARLQGLAAHGRRQVVIGGIESHVCVLQSALGFKAMGLDVFVVADAVTSRRPDSVALALDRFRANGVGVINTEMALFEWLHVSGTAEFKELSKLIK
ncbi:MAG: hydrolase [Rhodospirillaceae bacterium]|nr:hydrolase [Rhodospirillaceae bacterium]